MCLCLPFLLALSCSLWAFFLFFPSNKHPGKASLTPNAAYLYAVWREKGLMSDAAHHSYSDVPMRWLAAVMARPCSFLVEAGVDCIATHASQHILSRCALLYSTCGTVTCTTNAADNSMNPCIWVCPAQQRQPGVTTLLFVPLSHLSICFLCGFISDDAKLLLEFVFTNTIYGPEPWVVKTDLNRRLQFWMHVSLK